MQLFEAFDLGELPPSWVDACLDVLELPISDYEEPEPMSGTIESVADGPPTERVGIDAVLAAVARDVGHVAKDKRTNFGEKYQYRGIDAVLRSVGPVLDRYGVTVLAEDIKVLEREMRKSSRGKDMMFTVVLVQWVFRATGCDDERCYVSIGEAQDTGDKSFTKAQSVALRTALLNALHLPTEDPERDTEHGEQHELGEQQRASAPPPPRNNNSSGGGNGNAPSRAIDNAPPRTLIRFKRWLASATDIAGLAEQQEWLRRHSDRPDIGDFLAAFDARRAELLAAGRPVDEPPPVADNPGGY